MKNENILKAKDRNGGNLFIAPPARYD